MRGSATAKSFETLRALLGPLEVSLPTELALRSAGVVLFGVQNATLAAHGSVRSGANVRAVARLVAHLAHGTWHMKCGAPILDIPAKPRYDYLPQTFSYGRPE